jgi:CheY-like chemotaxis protein
LEDLLSNTAQYDLIIADYRMPGGIFRLDLVKAVRNDARKTQVFLKTPFDIASLAEFAVALEAGVVDEAIRKPISNEKLIYINEKTFLHNNH